MDDMHFLKNNLRQFLKYNFNSIMIMYKSTPFYYLRYMSKNEIKYNVLSINCNTNGKNLPHPNLNLFKVVDFFFFLDNST